MKRLYLGVLFAIFSISIFPTDLCAQIGSSEMLLAQSSKKVTFRSVQRLQCKFSKELLFFYPDGTFKCYEKGAVLSLTGTYEVHQDYIILMTKDKKKNDIEFLCTYKKDYKGNVKSLTFKEDEYVPMM